jgi:hypothetical protein
MKQRKKYGRKERRENNNEIREKGNKKDKYRMKRKERELM